MMLSNCIRGSTWGVFLVLISSLALLQTPLLAEQPASTPTALHSSATPGSNEKDPATTVICEVREKDLIMLGRWMVVLLAFTTFGYRHLSNVPPNKVITSIIFGGNVLLFFSLITLYINRYSNKWYKAYLGLCFLISSGVVIMFEYRGVSLDKNNIKRFGIFLLLFTFFCFCIQGQLYGTLDFLSGFWRAIKQSIGVTWESMLTMSIPFLMAHKISCNATVNLKKEFQRNMLGSIFLAYVWFVLPNHFAGEKDTFKLYKYDVNQKDLLGLEEKRSLRPFMQKLPAQLILKVLQWEVSALSQLGKLPTHSKTLYPVLFIAYFQRNYNYASYYITFLLGLAVYLRLKDALIYDKHTLLHSVQYGITGWLFAAVYYFKRDIPLPLHHAALIMMISVVMGWVIENKFKEHEEYIFTYAIGNRGLQRMAHAVVMTPLLLLLQTRKQWVWKILPEAFLVHLACAYALPICLLLVATQFKIADYALKKLHDFSPRKWKHSHWCATTGEYLFTVDEADIVQHINSIYQGAILLTGLACFVKNWSSFPSLARLLHLKEAISYCKEPFIYGLVVAIVLYPITQLTWHKRTFVPGAPHKEKPAYTTLPKVRWYMLVAIAFLLSLVGKISPLESKKNAISLSSLDGVSWLLLHLLGTLYLAYVVNVFMVSFRKKIATQYSAEKKFVNRCFSEFRARMNMKRKYYLFKMASQKYIPNIGPRPILYRP